MIEQEAMDAAMMTEAAHAQRRGLSARIEDDLCGERRVLASSDRKGWRELEATRPRGLTR